jgi:hypothetical protein
MYAALFYYIKHVFNTAKVQKKIQVYTLDHVQHICAINHTSKMSLVPQKKKDTKIYPGSEN